MRGQVIRGRVEKEGGAEEERRECRSTTTEDAETDTVMGRRDEREESKRMKLNRRKATTAK